MRNLLIILLAILGIFLLMLFNGFDLHQREAHKRAEIFCAAACGLNGGGVPIYPWEKHRCLCYDGTPISLE